MDKTKALVGAIIKGLQEKKGKHIVTVDLRKIGGCVCDYMIIGEGSVPTQVSALSDAVWDYAWKEAKAKPLSVEGRRYAHWIGMDYGAALVHIFLPETRRFYNLENLWADAQLKEIPDRE